MDDPGKLGVSTSALLYKVMHCSICIYYVRCYMGNISLRVDKAHINVHCYSNLTRIVIAYSEKNIAYCKLGSLLK